MLYQGENPIERKYLIEEINSGKKIDYSYDSNIEHYDITYFPNENSHRYKICELEPPSYFSK